MVQGTIPFNFIHNIFEYIFDENSTHIAFYHYQTIIIWWLSLERKIFIVFDKITKLFKFIWLYTYIIKVTCTAILKQNFFFFIEWGKKTWNLRAIPVWSHTYWIHTWLQRNRLGTHMCIYWSHWYIHHHYHKARLHTR